MAIYYVDSAAASGGNGSFATPWDDISDANTGITSGDTLVLNGSFTTRLQKTGIDNVLVTSLDPDNPATIAAAGSQCVRLNGSDGWIVENLILDGANYGVYFEGSCSNNTIRNCTLSNHVNEAVGSNGSNAAGTNNLITGCTVTGLPSGGSNDGINARFEVQFDVEDCVISGFTVGDGVSAHDDCLIHVRDTEIYDCDDGIHHVNTGGPVYIERCYIHDVTGDCVNFTPVSPVAPSMIVRDSVLVGSGTNSLDCCIRGNLVDLIVDNCYFKTVNVGANNTFGVYGAGSPIDGANTITIRNCVFDASDDVNAKYVGVNSVDYAVIMQRNSFTTPSEGVAGLRFSAGGSVSWEAFAAAVFDAPTQDEDNRFEDDLGLTGDPAAAAANAKPLATSPLLGSGKPLPLSGWTKDYAGVARNGAQWSRGPFVVESGSPYAEPSGNPATLPAGVLPTTPKMSRVVSIGRTIIPLDVSTIDGGRASGGNRIVVSSATAGTVRFAFGYAGTAPTGVLTTLSAPNSGTVAVTFTGAGADPISFTSGRRVTHVYMVASTEMDVAVTVY